MTCPHCEDLENAPVFGHMYAKDQAHRLANIYAEEQTKNIMGIPYISEYTKIYTEHFEELYMTFRSTHLTNFIDKLYEVHKHSDNLCKYHGLLVQPRSVKTKRHTRVECTSNGL
jgi:hypothetical protein